MRARSSGSAACSYTTRGKAVSSIPCAAEQVMFKTFFSRLCTTPVGSQMAVCLRYNRALPPVPRRRLLLLWLQLQTETHTGWLNVVLDCSLSGCLGASYTCSSIILLLGLEECDSLFITCAEIYQVRSELTSTVRRNGRHLLHLYYRR